MPILDDVKTSLRISHTSLDSEIADLIEAARLDLIQSGILSSKANDDTDALIKRAIILYCKAHELPDKDQAERFQKSYDMLKIHLSLSSDYGEGDVT